MAQGRTEGIIEGEFNAKIKIAKNLISIGMSIDQVGAVTGLPTEEIQKILNWEYKTIKEKPNIWHLFSKTLPIRMDLHLRLENYGIIQERKQWIYMNYHKVWFFSRYGDRDGMDW